MHCEFYFIFYVFLAIFLSKTAISLLLMSELFSGGNVSRGNFLVGEKFSRQDVVTFPGVLFSDKVTSLWVRVNKHCSSISEWSGGNISAGDYPLSGFCSWSGAISLYRTLEKILSRTPKFHDCIKYRY